MSTHDADRPPSVTWVGDFSPYKPSGYEDEARTTLLLLEAAGWAPMRRVLQRGASRVPLQPDVGAVLRRQRRRRRPPELVVHHYSPRSSAPSWPEAVEVARTMFETDAVPRAWRPVLARRHRVWLPSRHNMETFAAAGLPTSRLRRLPQTVDFRIYHPDVEPLDLGRAAGPVVVLSVFDWLERKGWRQLLAAWLAAFGPKDPVRLVLHSPAAGRTAGTAIKREVHAALGRRAAPVQVLSKALPAALMPALYAAGDLLVLPTRGEGWGRPIMEAMACGLPVITSAWGGQLDFVRPDHARLVEGRLVPVSSEVARERPAYAGHRWFEADVEDLAEALREGVAGLQQLKARAQRAREDLVRDHGPGPWLTRVTDLAREALD